MTLGNQIEDQAQSLARDIAEQGWAVTRPVLSEAQVIALRRELEAVAVDGRGGARNLLENESIRALALSPEIRTFPQAVLGESAFAVRALLFDKTSSANWKVIWHQDLTITTRERAEVTGYGPWTEKAGVLHVQPPVSVLERMIAIRIHLDPSGSDNGPVRVLARSHMQGRLSTRDIDEMHRQQPAIDCLVEQGGILAFRPLILHASAPATNPVHRRVIHIEFATGDLAAPLEWHRRVA